MSVQTLENPTPKTQPYVKITEDEAKQLRAEVLEMRRLALKFAQRAYEISKILDLITE